MPVGAAVFGRSKTLITEAPPQLQREFWPSSIRFPWSLDSD